MTVPWHVPLLLVLLAADDGTSQGELERLQTENARLRAQVADLQRELARLRLDHEDLQHQKKVLSELAGMTDHGQRVASQRALIEEVYHPASNRTVVRSKPEKLIMTRGSKMNHFMTLAYSFAGTDPSGPRPSVRWHIHSKLTGGIYQGEQGLRLLLDGEDAYVTVSNYRKRKRQSNVAGKRRLNKDDETITIELDEGLLRRIATSLEVRAAIKNIQFDLTLDQIATFQAMRRRIELAWDEPWKSDQRETRNKEHGTGTRPLEPRSEVVPPRE